MNRKGLPVFFLGLFTLVAPAAGFAATWNAKTVTELISTYVGYDCIYFRLDGVTEADPILPGVPWFAIPRNQVGAKDAYAMLLSAKLSGQLIRVTTNGTTSNGTTVCGNAIASIVALE